MGSKKCLNCNNDIKNNFCSVCGQKTSTHRFFWKYFFTFDILHGFFNINSGFLFTLKELIVRPGHSIREYIQGKRVHHFHYFSMLLTIVAVNHFIGNYSSVRAIDLHDQIEGFLKIAVKYNNLIYLIKIPFWAIIIMMFFNKSKHNYIEYIVLSIYMMSGSLITYPLYSLITVFYSNIKVLKILNNVVTILTFIYFIYFLSQYFSKYKYKKYSLIFKSFFSSLIIILFQSILNNVLNKIGLYLFS